MAEKITYTPAEHPSEGDEYVLTVNADGGTFAVAVENGSGGPVPTIVSTPTSDLAPDILHGALQTALEALPGVEGVTVSGGPGDVGGTTPYTIKIRQSPVKLVIDDNSLTIDTDPSGTVTLVQTKFGPNRQPAPGAGAGVATTRSVTTDPQYGSPSAYAPSPDPAAVASRVSAAASANAINTDSEPSAKHLGHTPNKDKWPPVNQ